MAVARSSCQGKGMGDGGHEKDRQKAERLAAALRENLRKRKAQARDIDDGASAPAKAGAQSGEAIKR